VDIRNVRRDVLASLVVFMVALPLCLAIARACGAPAEAGLITGVVGGVLVGLLAGSPLQVSGPAAGLVVIVLDIVQSNPDRGMAVLGVVVFLAGLMQLAAGAAGLGRWFRAVSPAVVLGMLGGIGMVIFAKQFHVMVDDAPADSVLDNLLGIPRAVKKGLTDDDDISPDHRSAALVGVLTLAVLAGWKLVPKRFQVVPAPLLAVAAGTALAELMALPVRRVTFDDITCSIVWPDPSLFAELVVRGDTWVDSLTVALIASAETLLCATAVDQLHNGPRTRYDRELAAQGAGNVACGLLGALPLTGVIVRSSANVAAGARTRLSAVLHGVWLLGFVLLVPGLLRIVPTACLAAVLVYTGVKLIEIDAIRNLWRLGRGEAVVCLATLVTVAAADLLTGVLLGLGLSVAKLAYTFSHLRIVRKDDPTRPARSLFLEGSATFLRLPDLARELEAVPAGTDLHVHFQGLSYIDHACLNLLVTWCRNHESGGGRLVIDWDTLHARFHSPRIHARGIH
jgi:MFS superfamily sulfate permease-like transporter